ncbi:MAG: geranylgeranylglyceryl/heptaprenylglyceryl phosphate synthase [Flavobacterium sp.]|nr:geranylgeranylglyceryl/heptaprenylglyceryl phosphate synthase [Flavobacterium sp.]
MQTLYPQICSKKANGIKQLAILLDPEKINWEAWESTICAIQHSPAHLILVGGSSHSALAIDELVQALKKAIDLPVVLFPGNSSQLSTQADAILFLSLLSGRNPDYLIQQQVDATPTLMQMDLEVISTGYLLIESGQVTSVERVSNTKPISRIDIDLAVHTAKAGEYLGAKLIYLEAGSGAQLSVPLEMIQAVSQSISVPLIVGGGLRSQQEIQAAYSAGADVVVIGTAFEEDPQFFTSC